MATSSEIHLEVTKGTKVSLLDRARGPVITA
jgi:hypothetical protein